MHFESKRLGDIDDGDVNGVWSTKIGTFLSFVPSSYRAQHWLLRPLVGLGQVTSHCYRALWVRFAARLRVHALCNARLCKHNLVVNVLLCSDQTLLNALDNLLSLYLVFQVLGKDSLPVTLTIQFEVGSSLYELLIDHSQLASCIVLLVNVQYVGGLPVRVGSLILRNPHEGGRLRWVGRIDGKIVWVITRDTGLSLVKL